MKSAINAQYERFLRGDPAVDEYLSVCEVRDIMDEIERRLAQRKVEKP